MLRNAILRLEQGHPELAQWLSDRLGIELSAFGVSVAAHLLLLFGFATVGYAVHNNEESREFQTEVLNTSAPDLTRLDDSTAIASSEAATTLEPVAGSFAPSVSAMIVTTPAPPPVLEKIETVVPDSVTAAKVVLPTATRLDQAVSIRGSGSEHVGGVEGAVDRLAVEILRQMERGRTLVVWAFDASGSLQSERERLGKHIKQVYDHIHEYDKEARTQEEGLLTIVTSFGKDRKVLTPEPTDDPSAIAGAIASVALDSTGVETTFGTVADIVRKWGKYKHKGQNYRTMVIVVTDEVGDDEGRLEDAIGAANSAKVPVYVLGSPALFGRAEGFMNYTDPKTKQVYYNLPVRQGPESVIPEQIRLPFWYDGPQYEFMDAGFGPFALSRLAGATGGIYFVTRMGPNRLTFDPAGMREYKPDWVSRDQYEKAVARHPIRHAVVQAAQITQQNLPGQPGLRYPAAESPAFKADMERNQIIVARTAYTVDAALEPISAVAKLRDRETSRRWQAHYDLIRGRLLAIKIRCYEYNWACAKMRKDAPKFTKPGANAWQLVPDQEIHYSDKAAAAGVEARKLLKRVIADHPGTPWALLAQRELKDPFGFKWIEVVVPPPPKQREGDANDAAKKKKAMQKAAPVKPPDLPKL